MDSELITWYRMFCQDHRLFFQTSAHHHSKIENFTPNSRLLVSHQEWKEMATQKRHGHAASACWTCSSCPFQRHVLLCPLQPPPSYTRPASLSFSTSTGFCDTQYANWGDHTLMPYLSGWIRLFNVIGGRQTFKKKYKLIRKLECIKENI